MSLHMVKKILIVLVLLPFLLLTFAPKKELFFMLQKQLAQQGISISGGDISENPIGLQIKHSSLFFKGVKVADIDKLSLWTLLVYSCSSIDKVSFDPSLKSFVPAKIENISLVHNVINPTKISISVNDKEYKGKGAVDLRGKTIHFRFSKVPSKSPILVHLKSNKGGWDYEQRF